MFLIVSKMVLCLILATILGMIIGYLLCKICSKSKCKKKEDEIYKQNTKVVSLKEDLVTEDIPIEMIKPLAIDKNSITPDNLKKIKGIGVKLEEALNDLGIYTFKQIASWDRQNITWVDEHLVFKGRIDRENWIEQAKILAQGKDTEFSKKFEK